MMPPRSPRYETFDPTDPSFLGKPPKETRRDQIVAYIAAYAVDHHNAPSTFEIAQHFRIAQHTVYEHMVKLMAEGRLVQLDGRWKLPEAEYIPPPDM